MSARDDFLQRLGGALADRANPAALTEALDVYDAEKRAEALNEAADAVLADTAHIRYGSATDYAQRHAALLRAMASNTTKEA